MTVLPNFVVIGASRSGTTSLHDYLGQHPDVYVTARKSPNYFVSADAQPDRENVHLQAMARQWIASREAYESQFHGVAGERAVGDVSPVYLQSIHSAGRIRDTLGADARIIAILRNPADRAYAHYLGRRRDGLEAGGDFDAIVDRELASSLEKEIAFGSYVGSGQYHHFLRPYFELFPVANIRVYLFEQLQENPGAVLRDLFTFLDVDPQFEVNTSFSRNRSGVIANPLLRSLWTGSVGMRTTLRPYLPGWLRHAARPLLEQQVRKLPLEDKTRRKILDALRDDGIRLQELLRMDLGHWFAVNANADAQR